MRKRLEQVLVLAVSLSLALGGCAAPVALDQGEAETSEVGESTEIEEETPSEEPSEDPGDDTEKPDEQKTFEELFPNVDISGLPKCDPADYPKVDGSTANLPLSYALYQAVTGETLGQAQENISCTKTDYAYYNMTSTYDDAPTLLLIYEPSQEIEDYLQDAEIKLERKPIGKDALVFLTNDANPVKSLTEQELIDIYTGRIKNWKQLGGKHQPIKAFQRSQNSGSQTLMDKLVMRGQKMADAPAYMVPSEMGELIEDVAYYNNAANALGYSVYFYARNMYTFPGLRFMQINGVAPSNHSIGTGEYPYVNDFYAVIRKGEPKDSISHQIYDWLTTEDGQDLIEACGYVPLDGGDNEGLPFDMNMLVKGDATYDLESGSYIVLDGRDSLGVDGVMVYDGTMQQIKYIEGISTERLMMVRRLDEPLPARNTADGKSGLYDLEHEEWILEPDYNTVEWNRNTKAWDLYSYWEEGDEYESHYYVYRDGTLEEKDREEEQGQPMGDDLWYVDYDTWAVTVKNQKGEELRSFHLADYGLSHGYIDDGYFFGTDAGTDSSLVFDADMNLVFSIDSLGEDLYTILDLPEGHSSIQNPNVNLYNLDAKNQIIQGTAYASKDDSAHYFLYDMKNHKLLSEPGDRISTEMTHNAAENVYRLSNEDDENIRLLDARGKLLAAKDGTPYQYSLGWNYYGYYDPSNPEVFIVDSENAKEHYELQSGPKPKDTWMPARATGPHLFVMYSDDGSTLWDGEECLLNDGYCTTWGLGDNDVDPMSEESYYGETYPYVFAQGSTKKTYLFDASDGSIVWEPDDLVNVHIIDGPVMYASVGAYTEFLTIDGTLVMRMFNQDESE